MWAPLPSIIFGTTALLAGVLTILLLPETLGRKMPETVDDALALSQYVTRDRPISELVFRYVMRSLPISNERI